MARRKKSDKGGKGTAETGETTVVAEVPAQEPGDLPGDEPAELSTQAEVAPQEGAPEAPMGDGDTTETVLPPDVPAPSTDEIWPDEPTAAGSVPEHDEEPAPQVETTAELTGDEGLTAAAGEGSFGDAPADDGSAGDGLTAGGGQGDPTLVTEEGDDAAPSADVLDDERLTLVIESLLFASDRPLGLADLKRLLGMRSGKRVEAAVEALIEKRSTTGVHVVPAGGGWQMRTSLENAPWVSKLLAGKPMRLSRAMLETLAIVAYRQPITRPEIDDIRGVDCGPVLKTLLDRGLIRIIGKKEEVGRPMLYGTTPEFLKTFSLRDLTELPTLREFHELSAEEQARVDTKLGKRGGETPVPTAAPSGPFTPHAPLSPDPGEDDALLGELEQAAQAAARAQSAGTEPPAAGSEPTPGSS